MVMDFLNMEPRKAKQALEDMLATQENSFIHALEIYLGGINPEQYDIDGLYCATRKKDEKAG